MNKQEMSFEIGSRLKSLREEKHLSYQGLADALLKKYGIKISKDSLRDYEICSDYRSKAKSLPNLGMRTEYLIALSDFYKVSTDYLLCKTDVRSQDIQVREICRYTGLTEEAVETLRSFANVNENLKNRTIKRIRWIINKILPSDDFFRLLRAISRHIDVFSEIFAHLSEENGYNGDFHKIDGLSFCDADILRLRVDEAKEELEALLTNTAIEAEKQKENPEVFWKRGES